MEYQFRQHYTRDEARALLPQIRHWLETLVQGREKLTKLDRRLVQRFARGDDVGGATANDWVRAFCAMKQGLQEFQRRDIQIKDLDRGLIDFPAILGGREVFLCWEKDDDDVEFWHELDAGYAGRERLP